LKEVKEVVQDQGRIPKLRDMMSIGGRMNIYKFRMVVFTFITGIIVFVALGWVFPERRYLKRISPRMAFAVPISFFESISIIFGSAGLIFEGLTNRGDVGNRNSARAYRAPTLKDQTRV